MTEKRFDFVGSYITLDGGVFATTKNRQNAELISRTLNQLYYENEQLKKDIEYYKTERLAFFEYLEKKDDLNLELKV